MGAVNPERLAEFIDRYRSFDDPDIPSFMYGSHYSTAVGVVLHYLVRLQPFAGLHKDMQVLYMGARACLSRVRWWCWRMEELASLMFFIGGIERAR